MPRKNKPGTLARMGTRWGVTCACCGRRDRVYARDRAGAKEIIKAWCWYVIPGKGWVCRFCYATERYDAQETKD